MIIATVHRWLRRLVWLVLMLAAGLAAWAVMRASPENLPWTPLRLDDPIGLFTGRKIAALTEDRAQCLALLSRSGLAIDALPARGEGQCAVPDAVRLAPGDPRLALAPANVAPSCPVMLALALWQWDVVQPAALRHFGQSVRTVHHFGAYSCRRLYGRATGGWSEHATADAMDIAGFTLADGTSVRVARDWRAIDEAANGAEASAPGDKAAFLREVRDGACEVFATVLSPDYNAQHADHLHLDQAERGAMGWRACR